MNSTIEEIEIRRRNRDRRIQKLEKSERAALRRSRLRIQLDNLTPNTKVYRFTGNAFDDRKEIDIDDQGLIKTLIRGLNLNNARVLFYAGKRLIKQVTYNTTSGKRFSTRVFSDWIEGNYDAGDNITIFRDELNTNPSLESSSLSLIIQPKSNLKSLKIKQRFLDYNSMHRGVEGFVPTELLKEIRTSGKAGLARLYRRQLLREIRKTDQSVKVIMLTAYSDTKYLMDAVELKLVKYLVKPITRV